MDVTSGPPRHSEHREADEAADSKPPHYLQKLTEEAEKLAAEVRILPRAQNSGI